MAERTLYKERVNLKNYISFQYSALEAALYFLFLPSVDLIKRCHAKGSRKLRPVPNVVLLPCRTQMKVSFRFRHGSSTPFVTIRLGTAELGSARLLSTEGLAVPHGSSSTWFQTACYCRAELNS